jgi:hypothetical protein
MLNKSKHSGFSADGRRLCFFDGGGGGQNTTTVQQSIPREIIPFVRESIQEGQAVAALPYVTYGGQRISQFAPQQLGVQREVMGMQTPTQYTTAQAGAQGTGGLSFDVARAGLGRALGYQPGTFGSQQAAFYMSPYQQAVTDAGLREAQRSADIESRNIGLQAAQRGTFGGSAEALQRAELARNTAQQRGDIQARGSEAAFQQAQQQFERDRAAAAGAAGMFGQLGSTGLGTSLQSALGLGELAGREQQADLSRLEAQRQVGQQVQDYNQRILSQQYQDFLAQRGYPREQAAFYSDIVRGTAPLFGQTTQTTAPGPSAGQQLLGAGLGALGAYKAFA